MPEQRQARIGCSSLSCRQRHGQQGVGAQAAFVVGAIQIDHAGIDSTLCCGIQTQHRLAQCTVDVGHGLAYALAQVTLLIAITQFDGFTRAGGCA